MIFAFLCIYTLSKSVKGDVRKEMLNMMLMQSLLGPNAIYYLLLSGGGGFNSNSLMSNPLLMSGLLNNNGKVNQDLIKNAMNTMKATNDDDYYYENDDYYDNADEELTNDKTKELTKRDIAKAVREESMRMFFLQQLMNQGAKGGLGGGLGNLGGLGNFGGMGLGGLFLNPLLGNSASNKAAYPSYTNDDNEEFDENDDYYYY